MKKDTCRVNVSANIRTDVEKTYQRTEIEVQINKIKEQKDRFEEKVSKDIKAFLQIKSIIEWKAERWKIVYKKYQRMEGRKMKNCLKGQKYKYIGRQKDRKTERQRDRKTYKGKDRKM